jgi:hypothetical protein
MTSERQITANRRNARKSTGPRSRAGKRRAARNSWKHGLSANISGETEYASLIDKLASKIAGKVDDPSIRECARIIASAQLELDRVRRIQIGLIECGRMFEPNDGQHQKGSLGKEHAKDVDFIITGDFVIKRRDLPEEVDETESVRRVLPNLIKLVRYARRAAKKRDDVVRRFLQLRQCQNQQEDADRNVEDTYAPSR